MRLDYPKLRPDISNLFPDIPIVRLGILYMLLGIPYMHLAWCSTTATWLSTVDVRKCGSIFQNAPWLIFLMRLGILKGNLGFPKETSLGIALLLHREI